MFKNNNWYYVKKLDERPDYFNDDGYMDHLMDGKHKVKFIQNDIIPHKDNKNNLYAFYDPISGINWDFKLEHILSTKDKLINILNR